MSGKNIHQSIKLFLIFQLAFFSSNAQTNTLQATDARLEIDFNTIHQTIDNFGASDAWSVQFVGTWPYEKRKAIADLLFSTKNDKNGHPKGIGLSLWRFNMGAGSAEQGTASGIKDEWRRAPSFMNENGSYNWEKVKGQLWFLEEAKRQGVKEFLAFFNSPPVQFTRNHKAFSSDGLSNIAMQNHPEFSKYITDVLENLQQKKSIRFSYISPANEPQWDWKDGNQEGNPYTNEQLLDLLKFLNADLDANDLKTKIIVPEAGKINYLIEGADKPASGNQINYFFEDKKIGIGRYKQVAPIVAGHSYFTTSPYSDATLLRQKLGKEVARVNGLKYWMSEYCILGNNAGEIKGSKVDYGIDPALYIAKVIHTDLSDGNAAAWHWWLAISPYNYKDGLITVDKNTSDGNFKATKMLWALGNYSRFIRPGYKRISNNLTGSDSLLCSSFVHHEKRQMVTVIINLGNQSQTVQLTSGENNIQINEVYQTSASANLEPVKTHMENKLTLSPKSIYTVMADYKRTND